MKKPEKNQGFNGIRTRDLRDTGAMLYQLSYEATHWEQGQFVKVNSVVQNIPSAKAQSEYLSLHVALLLSMLPTL